MVKQPIKWTHDKRADLIREEGKPGYICRGFRPEHGELLAAAPQLRDAIQKIIEETQTEDPPMVSLVKILTIAEEVLERTGVEIE